MKHKNRKNPVYKLWFRIGDVPRTLRSKDVWGWIFLKSKIERYVFYYCYSWMTSEGAQCLFQILYFWNQIKLSKKSYVWSLDFPFRLFKITIIYCKSYQPTIRSSYKWRGKLTFKVDYSLILSLKEKHSLFILLLLTIVHL